MISDNLKKEQVCRTFIPVLLFVLIPFSGISQPVSDSLKKDQRWNFHFQNTVIGQFHPSFNALYSGTNSLQSAKEGEVSISATLFAGVKLWKGGEVYFDPEISGGSGFSSTRGVAGFPNGEVYRVSDPSPHVYIARLYYTQIIPLSDEKEYVKDGLNQLAGYRLASYLSISAGKYSLMDFYDNNQFSHDPRTQFYNWALMGNGAWDYPANTRGYTYGLTFELVKPEWALRYSLVTVPKQANGSQMDLNLKDAHSSALEFEHKYSIGNQNGTIRLLSYLTKARMGNYKEAIDWGIVHSASPVIDSVNKIGNTKFGFGINIEQPITENTGMFFRASWNDGLNETWVFTEIDRHASTGFVFKGSPWNRKDDYLGLALIANGLSADHKDYLKAGGYGFIIGDGNLTYRPEYIFEFLYSFRVTGYPFWISPDYQLIVNPAYNKDRGPVHAFGIRAHLEI
jgi:high affinity Mn2+ porin